MSIILIFLNKEINYLKTRTDKWGFVVFVAVFVFVFLLVFQPFGVNNYNPKNAINSVFFISMLGLALVQALVLALCEFVIVPYILNSSRVYTIIIRIFLELIVLTTFTFLYYNILGNFHDWKWSSFFEFLFNISAMGIIPFAMVLLFSSHQYAKRQVELLELQPKFELTDTYVNLQSQNGKEHLTLKLSNLRYIEAQDNYVLIYYLDKDILKKHLLRAKMKDMENNLKVQSLIRCHRKYIVNLNVVEKIKRLGHQMELYLPNVSSPIPVSKSFLSEIETILDVRHT